MKHKHKCPFCGHPDCEYDPPEYDVGFYGAAICPGCEATMNNGVWERSEMHVCRQPCECPAFELGPGELALIFPELQESGWCRCSSCQVTLWQVVPVLQASAVERMATGYSLDALWYSGTEYHRPGTEASTWSDIWSKTWNDELEERLHAKRLLRRAVRHHAGHECFAYSNAVFANLKGVNLECLGCLRRTGRP